MRKYLFDVPYTIPAAYIVGGWNRITKSGLFERLPERLQKKMQRAKDKWHSVRVTKHDLDSIDDETWTKIAKMLDLKWEKVEEQQAEDKNIEYDPETSVRTPKQ